MKIKEFEKSVVRPKGKAFLDREEAAQLLCAKLGRYQGQKPLVLAIPRGGVPLGAIISEALGGELDVVMAHKLRAPHSPETAIGAVDESGHCVLSNQARMIDSDASYIDREKKFQLSVLESRRAIYRKTRPRIDPRDRVVIVVDDGLATGLTMRAALQEVGRGNPKKLVCAVPVAAEDSASEIAPTVDEFVCLLRSDDFFSVGQFYQWFDQISDEEVVRLLTAAKGSGH